MGRVYVTGDTHGDFRRFSTHEFPEQKEMTKDDFVIICGDFGGIWNGGANEEYWLKWLDGKPFTTLFVCGNHENFDRLHNEFDIVDFHCGKAHKINNSVYHLIRGEIYELCGKKFFCFGGASSHDIKDGIIEMDDEGKWKETAKEWDKEWRSFRINHLSWWKEELPSQIEMDYGMANLANHNYEVDYVISHCLPQQVASVFSHGLYKPDILTMYFNQLLHNGLKFNRWYSGHYHIENLFMSKFQVLYENIERII